jgi:hypothetical protein
MVKGTAHWTGDRSQSTLWSIAACEDRRRGHGMQKSVESMRRPMPNNSSAGQAVYEPFCGSGTAALHQALDDAPRRGVGDREALRPQERPELGAAPHRTVQPSRSTA